MELLVNGLLTAATLFAGGYCWILARRVHELKSLDKGLGGSIVSLTRQVELARLTLDDARTTGQDSRQDLMQLVRQAEVAANRLRTLIAACPAGGPAPLAASGTPEPDPGPPEPARFEEPPEAAAAPVPKPRKVLPVENPMRRVKSAAPETPQSEDDILDALRALAAGVN